ncbi:MAG TPA: hypothetical protein PK595_06805 [Bacteroidota bacterium]|nr:hypothetical protein [Bacteroidota bacterium]
MKLLVSQKAIQKYRTEIIPNTKLSNDQIEDSVRSIFDGSHYISDNERGILFRNEPLKLEIIVKNKIIVTIYPLKDREAKEKAHLERANGNRQ